MLLLTIVAVLQFVVLAFLIGWVAVQERQVKAQAAKITILEDVLGNFAQKVELLEGQMSFQQATREEILTALAGLREQARQVSAAHEPKPVRARNFSAFKSMAEEQISA